MTATRSIALALALLFVAGSAGARPVTDAQVRQQIIRQSIQSHGSYCVCPYQVRDRKKKTLCGRRSLYNRQGGYPPQCYAHDVTDDDVAAWRNEHGG